MALTLLYAGFHPKLAKVKNAVELLGADHTFGATGVAMAVEKVFQEAISNVLIEHIHSKVNYRDQQYGFTECGVPAG